MLKLENHLIQKMVNKVKVSEGIIFKNKILLFTTIRYNIRFWDFYILKLSSKLSKRNTRTISSLKGNNIEIIWKPYIFRSYVAVRDLVSVGTSASSAKKSRHGKHTVAEGNSPQAARKTLQRYTIFLVINITDLN